MFCKRLFLMFLALNGLNSLVSGAEFDALAAYGKDHFDDFLQLLDGDGQLGLGLGEDRVDLAEGAGLAQDHPVDVPAAEAGGAGYGASAAGAGGSVGYGAVFGVGAKQACKKRKAVDSDEDSDDGDEDVGRSLDKARQLLPRLIDLESKQCLIPGCNVKLGAVSGLKDAFKHYGFSNLVPGGKACRKGKEGHLAVLKNLFEKGRYTDIFRHHSILVERSRLSNAKRGQVKKVAELAVASREDQVKYESIMQRRALRQKLYDVATGECSTCKHVFNTAARDFGLQTLLSHYSFRVTLPGCVLPCLKEDKINHLAVLQPLIASGEYAIAFAEQEEQTLKRMTREKAMQKKRNKVAIALAASSVAVDDTKK